ncbi:MULTISPECIES: signal peptidase I [unclassified Paenibacillus]|uniref:signal peptidase I n=1 Tax=unclassified Paenibacillus TaxID=185978 RepID=UPI000954AF83|nr:MULTISPECIES: signal peptidase I [unclassified Paenibacillus]ASS67459.1 signal peptidase I [Paenibacillus sp. RUD330]SIQ76260.1 signal peptidase I [Paenibacillus sp. RU4X]SIQ97700.1 signal peptidase I [Paenibacillus sp. RU4T]
MSGQTVELEKSEAGGSASSAGQAADEKAAPAKPSRKSELIGWIRYIILLTLGLFLLTHTIGLDRVHGHSMAPTLGDGNILLINKVSTYFAQPAAGDVVIVDSAALGYSIVKRVIATEGDNVAIHEGIVYVNGRALPEMYTTGKAADMEEAAVRPGCVFVLGDNREPGESLDSRSPELGQVPVKEIQGYALVSLLPWRGIAKPLEGIG